MERTTNWECDTCGKKYPGQPPLVEGRPRCECGGEHFTDAAEVERLKQVRKIA